MHVMSSSSPLLCSKASYEILCPVWGVHFGKSNWRGSSEKDESSRKHSISGLLVLMVWILTWQVLKHVKGCCLFLSKTNGREIVGWHCTKQKSRSDTEKTLKLWMQKYWNTLGDLIIAGYIKKHVRLASVKKELVFLSLLGRRGQRYNWDPTSPVVLWLYK